MCVYVRVCVCVCVCVCEGIVTWRVKVGSLCLKKKSQMSRVPSIFVVKNTPGLVGLQHPSVSVCVCVRRRIRRRSLFVFNTLEAHTCVLMSK
jgi:hypothetical protein